jgi:hypothetical protein
MTERMVEMICLTVLGLAFAGLVAWSAWLRWKYGE